MTSPRQQKDTAGRCVLAVDLGSGGPKVGVVSERGEVLAAAFRPVPLEPVPGGGVEQDAELFWQAVKDGARAAMGASGVDPASIVGIGCTSQWSVTVPVDERGHPVMKAIHWLDGRGAPYNQQLIRGLVSFEGYGLQRTLTWLRLTGLAPTRSGVDALGHILFIKHQRPEAYRATYKFLEPQDYLTFRLTGRCTATQHSMVPVLLVDNRVWGSTRYAESLLRLTGIERTKLPDLVPNDAVIGPLLPDVAQELGLSPETLVIAGANDTSCSAIGAGAIAPFEGVIYIGTSQVLTCHLARRRTDPLHMIATMPSPLSGKHLLLAEQGAGGKCLEFFLKRLVYPRDPLAGAAVDTPGDAVPPLAGLPADAYQRLEQAVAGAPPGSGGTLFLPWLTGALAPAEDASVRGAFFNLSIETSRSHLARAVLEGLAFNSRWTIEAASRPLGRTFGHIRLAGGGARCRAWAQIHADILGMPVQLISEPTAVTLRGIAFLTLDRLRIRPLPSLVDAVTFDAVLAPIQAHRTVYDRSYHYWRRLRKQAQPVFKGLNGSMPVAARPHT